MPQSSLVRDAQGNLYGTIFALSGQYRTLYSFCAQSGCADGSGPLGTLVGDGHNHFFGVTLHGGTGSGTVFEFAP